MDRHPTGSYDALHELMPFMAQEILLVASPYDTFILEEDGRFYDRLFSEYMELHLSHVPRMTRVSTAKEALKLLRARVFDLVITAPRIADMRAELFAEKAKATRDVPVVVLAYDASDITRIGGLCDAAAIDRVFVWNGDNRLLLTMVKSVEDMRNAPYDTAESAVRVVIVVEDSPVFYSRFLPLLYTEIMEQTQSLIAEGINHIDRVYRMRTRPKIMLARNYEEALALFKQYRSYLLGVITDLRMPRNGRLDPDAGTDLAAELAKQAADVPILIQSAEPDLAERAASVGAAYVSKNSPDLLQEVRRFIRRRFGFGDFVFLSDTGEEVGRAGTIAEMPRLLRDLPDRVLRRHAELNQFSNWLMARGEFRLAREMRARDVDEFAGMAEVRQFLVSQFDGLLEGKQRGKITEFGRDAHEIERDFVRLGGGSLGGKGRGAAFIYKTLARSGLRDKYPDVRVFVPRTHVICTDEFDTFVAAHDLRDRVVDCDDATIAQLFLKGRITDSVHDDLAALLRQVRYPLAVRSSSLLEDSQSQPFAGVYSTFMLPNNHPSLRVRLRQLRRAIKLIYASTFFEHARAYMRALDQRAEEEKMAVLIQRLVGSDYGSSFYPTCAGVAQSYNFYPLRFMKPEEGIVSVALGLGRTVVEGGKALRFSPAHPRILPQMSTPDEAVKNTQRQFWALNLESADAEINTEDETLVSLELEQAETDGTLEAVGATYSAVDQRVYDSIYRPGSRLVNFAPMLKFKKVPLADILNDVLELAVEGMGGPVEVEFACDLRGKTEPTEFAILQVRPMATAELSGENGVDEIPAEELLLSTGRALGHGVLGPIRDVVLVPPEQFDRLETLAIAQQVHEANLALERQGRRYLLIGPGRWGTAERFLGIPVAWSQVSGARVIVELALPAFDIDPSQGTHFFHNITSLRVGYFSIDDRRDGERIDWDWLNDQPVAWDGGYVRHLRLDRPIEARVDGRSGKGVVVTALNGA